MGHGRTHAPLHDRPGFVPSRLPAATNPDGSHRSGRCSERDPRGVPRRRAAGYSRAHSSRRARPPAHPLASGAWAERRRASQERCLVGLFGVVEQGHQEPGTVAELPGDGAPAHRGGASDRVHGDALDTVLRHQPGRRFQQGARLRAASARIGRSDVCGGCPLGKAVPSSGSCVGAEPMACGQLLRERCDGDLIRRRPGCRTHPSAHQVGELAGRAHDPVGERVSERIAVAAPVRGGRVHRGRYDDQRAGGRRADAVRVPGRASGGSYRRSPRPARVLR